MKRMDIALRISGVSVTAVLVALVTVFSSGQETTKKLPRLRGRCQVCHRTEAAQWAESRHAKAWVSETFAQSTNNRTQKDCLSCHAPEKILVTGWGKDPVLRADDREHGIDCVACHEDADGAHHGTLGTQTEDHPVVKNEKFGSVEMCGTCHAKFGTVDELKASQWASDPKACVTCHMPEEKRPIAISASGPTPVRSAHAHDFRGAEPKMFQEGIDVDLKVEGNILMVTLVSKKVGHNFPTGAPFVIALVDVKVQDGGQTVLTHQTLFADDRDRGGQDTRLKPHETRTIKVNLQGKKGEATVRILHKYLRELPDDKATVLWEGKIPVG
ncbi:MAG: hypothetical protein NZ959_03605 [Armatimonadetes bacterium]|nr:hypothetical protein [Armatimonadota bacterium]MDW8121728.1 multiheme c-type cytochrome [Armatimonadota bacterium]